MPSQVLAILIRIRSRLDPRLLVHADQLAGLGQGALGVEAEAGIDLGGDPAGNDLEDLAAEGDEELVHERRGCGRPRSPGERRAKSQRLVDQMLVLRLLGRL